MKKIIALLAMLMPIIAAAQSLEGSWRFHPTYLMSQATEFIDTEHHVYALSNGALICLDKTTNEIKPLTQASSGLSDVTIRNIYYNYNKKYLLIVYNNSNLDILFEDGKLVNVSDLRDVVMNSSKVVNHVTFTTDHALLATAFGLVFIDCESARVSEFRNYGVTITSAAQVGNRLLVSSGGKIMATQGRHETFSDFEDTGIALASGKLYPIDENKFFLYGTNKLMRCTIDDNNAITTKDIVSATPTCNIQPTNGGWLVNFRASKYYYTIKDDGNFTATKTTCNNTELFSCSPDGDGAMWQIDNNGIHLKGSTDYHKPDGIFMRTAASPQMLYSYYNAQDNKFYVTTHGQRMYYGGNTNANSLYYVLTYDGANWLDATPTAVRSVTSPGPMAFMPGHDNVFFLTSRSAPNNLFRVVDGQVDFTFAAGTNNPYSSLVQPRIAFDYDGNLWLCSTRASSTQPKDVACMLPREKVLSPQITKDDWIVVSVPNLSDGTFQDQSFVINKDNVKVTNGGYFAKLAMSIWRGTPDSTGNGVDATYITSFVDQSGQAIDAQENYVYCLAADSTGNVWVGSSRSPVFFFNPSEAFEPNFRATRPQPLDGEDSPYSLAVCGIAVDSQNRKWLATLESGIYVVSGDGTQILKHFDTDNCDIPSSKVYSVAVSPTSAIALTDKGVAEFAMSEIPTAIDYTAVTAAPTIVEPAYTGFVTIGEVETGACVRITDRDGNIVREFTATGSQVAWDTCDETGERVPTGIYSVYAGRSAEQLPGTPQVRVKIIK